MNELAPRAAGPVSPYLPAAPAPVPSSDSPSPFELSRLLMMVREWRWLILASAVAGVLLAILVTMMTTPLYRATVTMEANPPKVEVMDVGTRDFEAEPSGFDFVATQVALLKSRVVAERTAQMLQLGARPEFADAGASLAERNAAAAGMVRGGMSAKIPEVGKVLTVDFVGPDPALAARIANGIAEAFIETNLERRYQASDHARKFLQEQIVKTRAALEQSERKMIGYQQAQGIVNTSTEDGQSADVSSLQGASLVAINQALATATGERVQAQAAYEQARLAAQAEGAQSASGLRSTLANVQAEYQEKRTSLKPDHPEMISLQSRIDELQRQIGREQAVASGGKVASLLAAYRAAQTTENRLRAQVSGLKGEVLDQRGRSVQYNILQREVDTNRSLYDALLQRYKEVGVGGGVGTAPVSIVDRAIVPGAPFEPNLRLNLLFGFIGGLLAGMGLAFALEYLNDTVRTRADVREKLHRSCLGVVPKEKDSNVLLEDFKDPRSSVSEAYSAIVAALRFSGEGGAPKAIGLTSPNAGEGKSSSALAIATNYARRGEQVLLIDADLRRPVFKGLSNERGLTNLLTSAADDALAPHVVRTEVEGLCLLPCGPIAPNPADLLATPRFAEILREACGQFDRVIVDGPPVSGMADASFLAAATGAVLMIIEAGRTRTRVAAEALERIDQTGAHLIGIVLTKSTEEASRYGYGSYRYYRAVEGDDRSTIMIAQQEEA